MRVFIATKMLLFKIVFFQLSRKVFELIHLLNIPIKQTNFPFFSFRGQHVNPQSKWTEEHKKRTNGQMGRRTKMIDCWTKREKI